MSFGYVCNSIDGTVTKFDLSTLAVIATLSVAGADEIVIDEAEAFAYVSTGGGVTQIDLSTFLVSNTVTVGGNGAQALALSPDDTSLFVAAGLAGFGDIHKIDIASFAVVGSALTASGGGGFGTYSTMGIAVDPYGSFVYVASTHFSRVVYIDKVDASGFTITSTLATTLGATFAVWGIVVDATGAFAYVFADALAQIDLGSFTVAATDTSVGGIDDGMAYDGSYPGDGLLVLTQGNATSVLEAELFPGFPPSYFNVNTNPSDSRQCAIGAYIYTSDWGTYSGTGTISQIDIGLGTVVAQVPLGTVSGNRGIAVKGHAPPLVAVDNLVMLA